jgi:hypothetical protein
MTIVIDPPINQGKVSQNFSWVSKKLKLNLAVDRGVLN